MSSNWGSSGAIFLGMMASVVLSPRRMIWRRFLPEVASLKVKVLPSPRI